MLLVRTELKPSSIHGIGIFAAEPIPKGMITWRFDPQFDLVFTKEEVDAMPEIQRQFMLFYAYFSPRLHRYVLCADGVMFMNHSDTPNIGNVLEDEQDEESNISLSDIGKGSELTINYHHDDLRYQREGSDIALRDIELGEKLTSDYLEIDGNDKTNPPQYIRSRKTP